MSLVYSQLEAERVTKPGGPGEPSEHEEVGAVTKALYHWKSQMAVTDNTIY